MNLQYVISVGTFGDNAPQSLPQVNTNFELALCACLIDKITLAYKKGYEEKTM